MFLISFVNRDEIDHLLKPLTNWFVKKPPVEKQSRNNQKILYKQITTTSLNSFVKYSVSEIKYE